MSLDKTLAQYKTLNELQEFAQAQQNTIVQLSRKVTRLEEERDHLKKLLEQTVPIIRPEGSEGAEQILLTNEETICMTQLGKLKEISANRELTLEESRRVEIFSKILATFRNAPKTLDADSKELKTEELLALVESDANGTEKSK